MDAAVRKLAWITLSALLLAAVVGGLVLLARPRRPDSATARKPVANHMDPAGADALRIGIVPERDIFAQRKRYRALADCLADELDRPVALVTFNTYDAILDSFAAKEVDAAFLGSMVSVLTMDRLGAKVVAKPEFPGPISTYRGVIFVRPDSPLEQVADLAGKSIAMVKTTTAGNLFPILLMKEAGVLDGRGDPRFVWVGTHDEVIMDVVEGRVDAGAAKNLRLDTFEAAHPELKMRRLARSEDVPNNALLLRVDVATELGPQLSEVLLAMHEDPAGRRALAGFGATRFVPCGAWEYEAVYDMVERLGDSWRLLGVDGPAPKRPADPTSRQ